MTAKHLFILAGLGALALVTAMLALRDEPPVPARTAATETALVVATQPIPVSRDADSPRVVGQPALPASAAKPIAVSPVTDSSADNSEASLMTTLRGLSGSDPALSLYLAKQGNERFKESPDVAERDWIIVKALMNMGRQDDARTEARLLIEKFPGTSWAEDAHRHLFVNPRSDPSERGYGKKTELP